MPSFSKYSFVSVILRAFIIFGKFIFITSLAKYFSTEDLGTYCLFFSSVVVATLFIGFDFYTFNTRAFILLEPIKKIDAIRDQFGFHLISYLLSIPLLLLFFKFDILPQSVIIWFILIIISEHLCTELYRLLIIQFKPISAQVNQLFRSTLWMLIITSIFLFDVRFRTLHSVFASWLIGNIFCLIFSLLSLKHLPWQFFFKKAVNFTRISNGLRLILPMYFSSISLKIIEFSDRYFINYYNHSSSLGIYFFFSNIANVIQSFIYAGIISIFLPKLINAYQNNEEEEYKNIIRKIQNGIIILCIFICTCLSICILPLLYFIDGYVYIDNLRIFWLMLFSNCLISISFIPHYILYSQNRDYSIMFSTIISCAIILVFHFFIIPKFGIFGAVISNIIGAFVNISLKLTSIKLTKCNFSLAFNPLTQKKAQ